MSQKLVTVYGATGAQGGSVVRALLRDKSSPFTIRGITRSPDSEAAKALAAQGVEIIKVNIFNKDELAAAFKGSWAVFVNTNSDDPSIGSPGLPTETQIGQLAVDAAVEAGAKYLIYSGLASASRITSGAVPCLCFDEKEHIGKYALSQPSLRSIVVNPAYYMENFNAKEWAGGSNEVPLIAIERDFGDIVHGVLLNPGLHCGKTIQAISQSRALEEIPTDFEHATGKRARFVPLEDWRLLKTDGTRVMQTVKEMFGFCYVSGGLYYGEPNNVDLSASLKQAAVAAQGRSGEDTCLYSLGEYFKDFFA
ncbi:NmrA domain-containing protein [Fusarium sp. LHS14.1]|nr:NmrA domain-containing protein [Fusarium sp. LHS14.1]